MFSRWRKAKRDRVEQRAAGPASQDAGRKTSALRVLPRYKVLACVLTDVGCHRTVNQDHAQYIHDSDTAHLATKGSLLVVADGMGGHSAGEVASKRAVDVITRRYYESPGDTPTALEAAFREANRLIYEQACQDPQLQGMGTTATALVLRHGEAEFAHVGDSRLYLIREGSLYLLSQDHSLVMEMVRQGLLSLEEARHHDDKNVILRALGTRPAVEVSVSSAPLEVRVGDQFLVCSDGLYDLVTDEEILTITAAADPREACTRLIARAKEQGGYDNITVGLLRLVPDGDAAEARPRNTREAEALRDDAPAPTREARAL